MGRDEKKNTVDTGKGNSADIFMDSLPQWHSCLCCLLEFKGIVHLFSLSNSKAFLLHGTPFNLFTSSVVFFKSNCIFVLCFHSIFSL